VASMATASTTAGSCGSDRRRWTPRDAYRYRVAGHADAWPRSGSSADPWVSDARVVMRDGGRAARSRCTSCSRGRPGRHARTAGCAPTHSGDTEGGAGARAVDPPRSSVPPRGGPYPLRRPPGDAPAPARVQIGLHELLSAPPADDG
jgi:hypothetical protein